MKLKFSRIPLNLMANSQSSSDKSAVSENCLQCKLIIGFLDFKHECLGRSPTVALR